MMGMVESAGLARSRRHTSRPSPPGTMMSSRKSAGGCRSASGIRLVGSVKQPRGESCCFKVMLHQPRNISVVFQHKYGLAQPVCPRPAAVEFVLRRPHGTINRLMQSRQINCKRLMNLAAKQAGSDVESWNCRE